MGMNTQPQLLRFQAFSLSIEVIGLLRNLMPAIQKHDASLTKQLRTAASSISLNLAESRGRRGRDSQQFLRIAHGSTEESLACLFVAQAWGYVQDEQIASAVARLHHLSNMIISITR
jgi:four helix bundle protein